MDRTIDSTAARLALPCQLWTGSVDADGYGKDGSKKAHRVAWEKANGPIPKGLELDHICVARLCVALYHLDLVTHAENIRRLVERGNHWETQKTHCPAGHDYSDPKHGVVWGGHRYCRTCRNAQMAARRAAGMQGSVEVICQQCGASFHRVPSETRRFCSLECKGVSQDRKRSCAMCGALLPPNLGKRRTCSAECSFNLRSLVRRGEGTGNARLTEESVREARRLLAEGNSQQAVAAKLGVTQTTIGRLARGVSWSHVG